MQKDVNPEAIGPSLRFFHRRWSVPVVALLHRERPLRFNEIAAGLPRASRDTLAETLADLQGAGVVARQEGGGYALTAAGAALGEHTRLAAQAVTTDAVLRVALKKWPMPILVAVGRGAARFNEIKTQLPGITSGALAPALKDLEAAALVERSVNGGYPPVTSYRLAADGRAIFPVIDALIRACAAIDGEAPGV